MLLHWASQHMQLSALRLAPKAQRDTPSSFRSAQAHSGRCAECSRDEARVNWCITPSDPARLTVIDGWPGAHRTSAAVCSGVPGLEFCQGSETVWRDSTRVPSSAVHAVRRRVSFDLRHILLFAVPKAGYQPADVPSGIGPCPPGTAKANPGTQACRQCAGGHQNLPNTKVSRAAHCSCPERLQVGVLCSLSLQHDPWRMPCHTRQLCCAMASDDQDPARCTHRPHLPESGRPGRLHALPKGRDAQRRPPPMQ